MSSPEHPKSPADLVGWTPFQIVPQPDNIYVHWIQLGDLHFADPFFGQTVERRLQEPARQVVTTPITALAEVAGLAQSLPPGAFVFHCARAGSTLLANAFRVLPGNLVLAEPQPINQLMGAPHRHQPEGPWPAWLRDLLACLGQPRRPGLGCGPLPALGAFRRHVVLALAVRVPKQERKGARNQDQHHRQHEVDAAREPQAEPAALGGDRLLAGVSGDARRRQQQRQGHEQDGSQESAHGVGFR